MTIPPQLVATARCLWWWQWQRLMDGLAPADAEGNYQRRPSQFAGRPLEPLLQQCTTTVQRPLLIIGRSCPWAHRTRLVHQLCGLADAVALVLVEPDPQAGRWVFPEPLLGCRSLQELYRLAGANPQQRATVPLLLDPGSESRSPVILSNESAELVQLLNRWPGSAMDLEPEPLLEAIEQWSQQLQHALNDGVYRCGFARSQTAYGRAEASLFAALQALEESLSAHGPWLCGAQLTLADVRLFPTLIRWEQVYAPLFGCSRQPLWSFPALWQWRARFLALPGVLDTCDPLAWRTDYFGALFPLRPSALVPAGPMDGAALQQLVSRPIPTTMET